MKTVGTCAAVFLSAIVTALQPVASAAQTKAGGGKPAAARGFDAARVLGSVVHLTDNDVRFRTTRGTVVMVDPVFLPECPPVKKSGMARADLILITHIHADHFDPVALRVYAKGNPALLLAGPADVLAVARASGISVAMTEVVPGREYSLAGIRVRTLPAYFLGDPPHPRGSGWVGYLLTIDGTICYVTGDTQPLPEMADLKPDVLFPILMGCGGNLEQALEIVTLCKPRVVVPVHTGGAEDVIQQFLARLPQGVKGAHYKDGTLVPGPGMTAK